KALAKRKDELRDVYIISSSMMHYCECAKCDPSQEHFIMNDVSFSVAERKMQADGMVYHIPSVLHEIPEFYQRRPSDVVFVTATPMDDKGYFNLSVTGLSTASQLRTAKHIVVEVHDKLPLVFGNEQWLHISQVDHVVEVDDSKLPLCLPNIEVTDIDIMIAEHIVKVIEDGACLQLGVGGTPNHVGKIIASSDLKDLGVHTELFADAYVEMFEGGQITNNKKSIDKGISVCNFAFGSQKLYEFVDRNPLINIAGTDYTNDPFIIMKNDKVISICSCLNVDILGQVSSESVGRKQVSGTGGQMDFHYAAFHSQGGKGIVCLPSARLNKKTGKYQSNIVPSFIPGTVVSLPSALTGYVVTEYGMVNLKGKSTWERAEDLVSIAHPECQDELIQACQEANIWRKRNK
ncbi:MAG: acetyl-CoA hydrolase/transferase C-terminal domain-containing protein, partial [Syntrophomonas sp.]|nr:acetyl-CoA hydrolase/transferase C-terminal domain-containing protein [Syntrophomonas sp.]